MLRKIFNGFLLTSLVVGVTLAFIVLMVVAIPFVALVLALLVLDCIRHG